MSQPSALPRWADTVVGNTTYIVEPSSGRKDTGWAASDQPAAQHLNWYMELVYEWVKYLKEEHEAGTYVVSAMSCQQAATTPSWRLSADSTLTTGGLGGMISVDSNVYPIAIPIPVRKGDVITAVRARVNIDAGHTGANELYLTLFRGNGNGTSPTDGFGPTGTPGGGGPQTFAATGSFDAAVGDGEVVYAELIAANAGHIVYSVEVDYTRP